MKGVRRVKKTRKKVRRNHTRRVKGGNITSTPSSTNDTINWNEMASEYRNNKKRRNAMSTRHIANTMEARKRLEILHKKSAKNIKSHNNLEAEGIIPYFIPIIREYDRKKMFKPSNV
jgi:hypothetical protein